MIGLIGVISDLKAINFIFLSALPSSTSRTGVSSTCLKPESFSSFSTSVKFLEAGRLNSTASFWEHGRRL